MTHIKEILKKNSREIFPTTKRADKKITKPTFKPTAEERALVEQMSSVGIPQESGPTLQLLGRCTSQRLKGAHRPLSGGRRHA
jgi:hypothetical protein